MIDLDIREDNKLRLPKEDIEKWNKLLELTEIDFQKEGLPEDSTLYRKTKLFSDKVFADLEVCSGQTNLWCQVVWYLSTGHELCCSDANADTIDGPWECAFDGKYNLEVVAEDA